MTWSVAVGMLAGLAARQVLADSPAGIRDPNGRCLWLLNDSCTGYLCPGPYTSWGQCVLTPPSGPDNECFPDCEALAVEDAEPPEAICVPRGAPLGDVTAAQLAAFRDCYLAGAPDGRCTRTETLLAQKFISSSGCGVACREHQQKNEQRRVAFCADKGEEAACNASRAPCDDGDGALPAAAPPLAAAGAPLEAGVFADGPRSLPKSLGAEAPRSAEGELPRTSAGTSFGQRGDPREDAQPSARDSSSTRVGAIAGGVAVAVAALLAVAAAVAAVYAQQRRRRQRMHEGKARTVPAPSALPPQAPLWTQQQHQPLPPPPPPAQPRQLSKQDSVGHWVATRHMPTLDPTRAQPDAPLPWQAHVPHPSFRRSHLLGRTSDPDTASVSMRIDSTAWRPPKPLSQVDQLRIAVTNMALAQPPRSFAGCYMLSTDSVGGGQSLVVFARGCGASMRQFAIKFLFSREDYDLELGHYNDAAFRNCLPELDAASANDDGAARGRGGYNFPPYLVLERGVTLTTWLEETRYAGAVFAMASEVAALLDVLHRHGSVHRDIKPENLLLTTHTQRWRLLDFGIAAPAGQTGSVSCTPRYAPPEAILAHAAGVPLTVHPSLDIWGLGVVVFEALSNESAYPPCPSLQDLRDRAAGRVAFPWELPAEQQPAAWARSRARGTFARCLARRPEDRPSAAALVMSLHRFNAVSTQESRRGWDGGGDGG